MGLEQRVTELERRLAELEGVSAPADAPSDSGPGSAEPGVRPEFWALQRLKAELASIGSHDGGVLFTGSVLLPTRERYEWQYGTATEQLLDEDWSREADAFAALGHGVRLRLLKEVVGGRRTAAELAEVDGMGTSGQVYHHLRQLTGAGWLQAAGRGRYEIPAARVVPLLVMLSAARP
ncbi:ArsR/SmtB family transcription factor [Streptomyces sp. NRRL F-5126]|uniref:ArsR/SmtB family transcription factor n=1 Tax=Streptomyces sp. NRRL F-5126 TaxID=1463857 RepID=UPI0004CA68D6|nr:winged helix-turn-helix domain-containing protein [Streptomyces sp. NRRL F-5126]